MTPPAPAGSSAPWPPEPPVTFSERSGRSVRSVSGVDPVAGQTAVTTAGGARRLHLASPVTALVLGGLVLALVIADVPLAGLAHQSLDASGGSLPVWISAGFGVVGFVVAWRKPRNPLGWAILGLAVFGALSQDASFYTVADYRLRHGGLPLGWVALLAQPGWAPELVLLGLVFLLFPDGRPPSRRWRWVLWTSLAVGTLWIASAFTLTVGAIIGHHLRVDPSGNLLVLDNTAHNTAWWNAITAVATLVLAVCWLGSLGGQVLSYRRSSGERRQQLKWLMTGSAISGACLAITFTQPGGPSGILRIVSVIVPAGFLALPLSMGVAILKYRLFDIDRIISRTLAYATVTGLLVGVYAGMVLLATQVVSITAPVAVAASTLAAAALFNPLRRRVQRAVDRRFNRARYDADAAVAAFAGRLKDAVDLDAARAEILDVVHRSLEPAHVSVWIRPGE